MPDTIKTINPNSLILASASPRRKELLAQMGIRLKIVPANLDEGKVKIKEPDEYVKELAYIKAKSVAKAYPDSWVLGADTIVVFQDKILGKPESKSHAREMLGFLSNKEHTVYTGYCLMNLSLKASSDMLIKKAIQTRVKFKTLTEEEIVWYVSTQESMDKAGAYGIQGIGSFLVKEISGSFTNVVGLPVCELFEDLLKLKIIEFNI